MPGILPDSKERGIGRVSQSPSPVRKGCVDCHSVTDTGLQVYTIMQFMVVHNLVKLGLSNDFCHFIPVIVNLCLLFY